MKRQKLTVEKRTILGKKLKKLRKQDILPANIYGKDIKSISVQVPYKDFEKVYKEAGETGLVDIELDGQIKPSLIHNVQRNYYKKITLHADFYQVNLKEKVKTMVPITILGIAKAVTDKLGLLLQPLSQIEVEALPTDLPEKIDVNVEHLAAVNDQITVADIKAPAGVTILTTKEQVVAKIGELISKAAQEQAAAEQAAQEAAKAAVPATDEGAAKPAESTEAGKAEAASASSRPAKPTEAGKPTPQPTKEKPKA